jgi:hypothetical protein
LVYLSFATLGVVAILVTPAALGWKLCSVLALFFTASTGFVFSLKESQSGSIDLIQDGTALVETREGRRFQAQLKENAWATRWLCVLTLFEQESGRHYYCVICASENSPDEYRRLLKYLNMRTSTAIHQKATW